MLEATRGESDFRFFGCKANPGLDGAPRASPWSPQTIPTYAPGRRSASVRRRQGFGGSSAGERNPPKHGRMVAVSFPVQSYAFLHGQGRGFLRRRMKGEFVRCPLGPQLRTNRTRKSTESILRPQRTYGWTRIASKSAPLIL